MAPKSTSKRAQSPAPATSKAKGEDKKSEPGSPKSGAKTPPKSGEKAPAPATVAKKDKLIVPLGIAIGPLVLVPLFCYLVGLAATKTPLVDGPNTKIFLSVFVGGSGFFHLIPMQKLLKAQEDAMGVPWWFIESAGALMLISGVLYFYMQEFGLWAMCFCMGGAAATGALMSVSKYRPGSIICSSFTLALVLWSSGISTTVSGMLAKGFSIDTLKAILFGEPKGALLTALWSAGVASRCLANKIPLPLKTIKTA